MTRGDDHLGDVSWDTSRGPRVPRSIRLWVRHRGLWRLSGLCRERAGWASGAREFTLEFARGEQIASGTMGGSDGLDTGNGVFGALSTRDIKRGHQRGKQTKEYEELTALGTWGASAAPQGGGQMAKPSEVLRRCRVSTAKDRGDETRERGVGKGGLPVEA